MKEKMPPHLNSKLGQLDNGTTLRHVYKRGKYSGDDVTAHVQDERISVPGDSGPDDSEYSTRTPSGAAREADRFHRGPDARDDPYKLETLPRSSVCILEAKAANEEQPRGRKQRATEDVREYVVSDTFAKYLTSTDHRYLIAIGTDGFRWVLTAKDVRRRTTECRIDAIDLAPVIEAIAQEKNVIEGTPDLTTPEMRERLTASFVPAFAARSIDDYVEQQFDGD